MSPEDERLLHAAIALAVGARNAGNPPFGSLLVGPDGEVLAREHNTSVTDSDITAHPELKLARWAARELDPATAAATTMYTSCQPCGMCAGAIERSGLGRVVFALSTEQLTAIKPPSGQGFRLEGSAMADEVAAIVAGYYS
jgi:tRNA(Arg) A34 adenosine deaminase TadA